MGDHPVPDFSVKPTLTGRLVLLRPFQESDFPGLRAALRDPEVARLTGSVTSSRQEPEPDDPTREKRLREWYTTRNAQTDRLDLAVVDLAGGECVGEMVLNKWDPDNLCCTFRTLIGPGGRDRGLGTEAIRMFIGYGFEQLRLHRISLEVFAFNPRARRVYEKVGFVAEGVLRDALRFDGQWIDATVMSILAPEWARHRGRP
ncbi:GNAT family N-acetyltransferase [Catellatospora tritici]|uniref:GNAT family N-acetyltransferase n=1 Tax=Catellatospora tritici TaxID=2851566 RepID=UPI0027DF0253|nr:GNAT family protein [Catellatospora tritici]